MGLKQHRQLPSLLMDEWEASTARVPSRLTFELLMTYQPKSTALRKKAADVPDSWDALEPEDDEPVVKDEDANAILWQQA